MKTRKKLLALALSAAMAAGTLAGTGASVFAETEAAEEVEMRTIVDGTGREVTIPAHPQHIAIIQMVLPVMCYTLQGNADNFVAIPPSSHSGWEISMLKTLAPDMGDVDYEIINDDREINMEALMTLKPDLAISFGGIDEEVEQLEALGVPTVLYNTAKNLDALKELITGLGDALNCQDRAAELIAWYEETEELFASKSDEIAALSEEKMPKVLHFQNVNNMKIYPGGMDPYITTLEGGRNIELTGDSAETGVPTMEELLNYNPDIIFISNFDDVTPEDFYENRLEGQDWSAVNAVVNHQVYKVPSGLYRWAPPNTVEKPLYMMWTASIVQPEIFADLDVRQEIKDFYKEFLSYDLTEEEVDEILHADLNANSGAEAK